MQPTSAFRSSSKPFPDFSSIYLLPDVGMERPFRVRLEVTEEQSIGLTQGEITLPAPARARHYMGRKIPSDIIWTGWGIPMLVSERVISVLQNDGLTGWSTYDIELLGHDGAVILGYHGLAFRGRCGPVDDSKAVRVLEKTCSKSTLWRGMCFDPDTWDGSDLFSPESSQGLKLITHEVKRAFDKAKFKNIVYTPLTEAEFYRH